jgi:hypothetical protein
VGSGKTIPRSTVLTMRFIKSLKCPPEKQKSLMRA